MSSGISPSVNTEDEDDYVRLDSDAVVEDMLHYWMASVITHVKEKTDDERLVRAKVEEVVRNTLKTYAAPDPAFPAVNRALSTFSNCKRAYGWTTFAIRLVTTITACTACSSYGYVSGAWLMKAILHSLWTYARPTRPVFFPFASSSSS